MAQNTELHQLRADAEAQDREDSERRAEKRGWPVNTADGEVIIAETRHDGAVKVLATEDGTEYVMSPETHEWIKRSKRAKAASADNDDKE